MSRRLSAFIVAAAVVTAAPALAGEVESHSGTLVAVDVAKHTLKLEEMGPWTGPATRPIVRSITLAPETKIDRVHRSREAAPAGWHGGYVTSPMSVAQLHAGEFTTVKVTRHGKQLTAVSVDVFSPSSAVRPMGS